MKIYFANHTKRSTTIMILTLILIITAFYPVCAKQLDPNLITCNNDDYSLYPKVIEQVLPSHTIEQTENKAYYIVADGATTEAFDTQSSGAIETGIAKYWYPHYLATVIIAIDRNQTDVVITGWKDLSNIQEEVAFSNTPVNNKMLLTAMAYGLEGENYSLSKATQLLASLYKNKLLKINSFDSPVIICYDYQAAGLARDGRNIEIIVPSEGTFTYEKGLLSNQNIIFDENIDTLLLQNGLRLINGESDTSIYPDNETYKSAVKVTDYKHFAKVAKDVNINLERKVLKINRLMSIDHREHLYAALLYIGIVAIWTVSVMRRSMQKGVSYSAFFTGLLLSGWALARLIRYQVVINEVLSRYLWYSYYIFQLSLPLVMIWMAWAIDKPQNEILPPKWWRRMAILIATLIILVFTNDLHGFVFNLDLNRPDWDINYTYGFLYYVILFISMMNITTTFVILIKKSIKSPRRMNFIFPLGIFALFSLYTYKYIVRDPLFYQTDITIVTGFFLMMMFLVGMRSGLIPVNTKYARIFKRSPLKIQITNNQREVAIASALAVPVNKYNIGKAIDSAPNPVLQEDGSLLFANQIPGGHVLWSEDISKIQRLHKEIQQSTEKLKEANAILAKEEKTKRAANEEKAKKQLMEQLENEIATSINELSNMIENLEQLQKHSIEANRIALQMCYIKRRCNLFFQEKEMQKMEMSELIIYINEIIKTSRNSNVQIAMVNKIKGNIPIRYATLFYDFFYIMADLAIQKNCPYIILDFEQEEMFTMRFLPTIDIGTLNFEPKLIKALKKAKGIIVKKEIEDTIGISISFPVGGVKND